MSQVAASAPGKLYIAGEYAVVEPGHPAILVAVDRFVGKGGRFVRGRGRLVAPDRVEVGVVDVGAGRRGSLALRGRRRVDVGLGTAVEQEGAEGAVRLGELGAASVLDDPAVVVKIGSASCRERV